MTDEIIFTIGHSTRTIDEFSALLRDAGVTRIVDVRSIPRSRAMPQFNADTFPATIESSGIGYTHLAALGGRRGRRKGAPPSHNTFWKVVAFRNYADYAETAEFGAGLSSLIALAEHDRCAVMCAEAVWWRCHRRIIADYLIGRGLRVQHIMGAGKLTPATLTPGAHVMRNGIVWYPGPDNLAEPTPYP
jgi:uncharacterized protein (DUF488 family)